MLATVVLTALLAVATRCDDVTVSPTAVLHPRPALLAGCHVDLGYAHQGVGMSAQLLFSESFENSSLPINGTATAKTTTYWDAVPVLGGSVRLSADAPYNGLQYVHLEQQQPETTESRGGVNVSTAYPTSTTTASAASGVGVRNKGLHSWGLVLKAGHAYTGYVFARAAKDVEVVASLVDDSAGGGSVLAAVALHVQGDGLWHEYRFSLTPSASTTCRAFPWGVAPLSCYPTLASRPAHACWQCEGSFVLRLAGAGSVDLDMASLMPGAWGLFQGLPVRKEIVTQLQAMGIDSIRLGGTYVETDVALNSSDSFGYRWKALRGPAHTRAPIVQLGSGVSSFWGPQVR